MLSNPLRFKPDDHLARANKSIDDGDFKQAAKVLKLIIKKQRPFAAPSTFVKLSRCYAQIGQLDDALLSVRRGIKTHPNSATLFMQQYEVYAAKKEWAKAIESLVYIDSNLGPEFTAPAAVRLCRIVKDQGDNKQLLELSQKYEKRFPESVDIKAYLAEALTINKDWPLALQVWQQILDLNKHNSLPESLRLNANFNISLLKRLLNIGQYAQVVKKHSKSKTKKRYALATSYSKGYDSLKLPELVSDQIDYFVFTDDPDVHGFGLFKVRPLPIQGKDGARSIRYVKTHPHELFTDYDVSIWLDTSLMLVGDIIPKIKEFLDSKEAIASNVHPLRKSIYEEYEACVKQGKGNIAEMSQQIEYYKKQNFHNKQFSENGFLMFKPRDPRVALAMNTWWEQITKFSARDQLSFNYSLETNNVSWFKLIKPPHHMRDNDYFVWRPHHQKDLVLSEFNKSLGQHIK